MGAAGPEGTGMTTTLPASLLDDDLEAQLDERGWVVVPMLDADEVAELRDWYLRNSAGRRHVPDGAYNDAYAEFSVIHTSPTFREAAFDEVVRVVGPRAARHLRPFEPLVANFVNKPARTGVVPMHQNWSVVDERRYRSLSVWVALVDCDRANGALELLRGTHRYLRTPRGMWAYEAFTDLPKGIEERLECVSVRSGEAIILDDAVVHYSQANTTDRDRLAIQLIVVPAGAEARFFRCIGADQDGMDAEVLHVSAPFFWDFWHGDGDLRHAEVIDRIRLPPAAATAARVAEQFADPTAGSPPIGHPDSR